MLDESDQPFLIDFGISKAKVIKEISEKTFKVDCTLVGTENYMSPELIEAFLNDEDVIELDPYKSDVFSFGFIILEKGTQRQITHKNGTNRLENLKWMVEKNLEDFRFNFAKFISTPLQKEQFSRIFDLLEKCLKFDSKERFDFFSLFLRTLSWETEKMKYLLFVQDSSMKKLEAIDWEVDTSLESKNELQIEEAKKESNQTTPNNSQKIPRRQTGSNSFLKEDPVLQKYCGILENQPIDALMGDEFKLGFSLPYETPCKFEDFLQFQRKKYVLLGAKEKNSTILTYAALGYGQEVLKETKDKKESHLHNKVYWYFLRKHSLGCSSSEDVFLNEADEKDTGILSWLIDGNIGGWRMGKLTELHEPNDYMKVLFYKD